MPSNLPSLKAWDILEWRGPQCTNEQCERNISKARSQEHEKMDIVLAPPENLKLVGCVLHWLGQCSLDIALA